MDRQKSQQMSREEYEAYLHSRSNRKKRRRKGKNPFLGSLILVLVLLALAVGCFAFFFRVDDIILRESDLVNSAEVIAATGVKMGDNLILLDTKKASEGIYALNPEIDACIMEKKYPSTLVIQLVRGTTKYLAEGKGGYYFVSGNNRIIGATATAEEGLPILRGLDESLLQVGSFLPSDHPAYSLAVKTAKALESADMPDYNIIDVQDIYSVNVLYNHHVRLVLGNELNLETKASSIAKTYRANFTADEYGIIDGSVTLHQTSVRKDESFLDYFKTAEESSEETVSAEEEASSETASEAESQQPEA